LLNIIFSFYQFLVELPYFVYQTVINKIVSLFFYYYYYYYYYFVATKLRDKFQEKFPSAINRIIVSSAREYIRLSSFPAPSTEEESRRRLVVLLTYQSINLLFFRCVSLASDQFGLFTA